CVRPAPARTHTTPLPRAAPAPGGPRPPPALASVTAILARAFDGAARAKAFGLFGTFLGAGLAFGPAFGGALVNLWGWRSVFLVLAAVSALVLLSTPLLPRSEPHKGPRFDWSGSLAFGFGVALFVLALVEGPGRGWTDPVVLAAAAGCLALMVVFVVVERRTQHPMFDLGLFARPRFLAVCVVPLVLAFSFVAVVIVLPPYLTSTSGMSALRIGVVLLLLTGPSLVMPALTGLVAQKVSQRTLFVVLLACSAAGAAGLTLVEPGASAAAQAGPLLLLGIGYGMSLGILDGAAVSAVEPERMGMAAGMFNTVRLASDTISMAGLGTLVTAFTKSVLDSDAVSAYPGGGDELTSRALQGGLTEAVGTLPAGEVRDRVAGAMADAYANGLHTTMWIVAAACAVSAVAVGGLLSRTRTGADEYAGTADDSATSPEPAAPR
ncbi:MFS transporter, partial [Streptomyces sp. NPDC003077]|uniref:MFS transporter n=1 Tax=Streptomyces sp. NPDC003077 TaxID=3154443 RepID=UPI0033ADB032